MLVNRGRDRQRRSSQYRLAVVPATAHGSLSDKV
jgi:hypothetical protein